MLQRYTVRLVWLQNATGGQRWPRKMCRRRHLLSVQISYRGGMSPKGSAQEKNALQVIRTYPDGKKKKNHQPSTNLTLSSTPSLIFLLLQRLLYRSCGGETLLASITTQRLLERISIVGIRIVQTHNRASTLTQRATTG